MVTGWSYPACFLLDLRRANKRKLDLKRALLEREELAGEYDPICRCLALAHIELRKLSVPRSRR
jgi:hypothetical protein